MLKLKRYVILKITPRCFKYKAVLLDAENQELFYYSKTEFKNILECSNYVKQLELKGTSYELQYGKIIEVIPVKFDEYYQKLISFFHLCGVAKAELNDWCKIRKATVKLFEAKEITKEEMMHLNDRISFHFKNQGRALELSTLLDKIKQKRVA